VPDILGYRERIGFIVPSTNTTVGPQAELFRVPGVTCHFGRVVIEELTEEAIFEQMTTMHEGMGIAIDQIMSGSLFGAIVAC
jgi:maleate isomerase